MSSITFTLTLQADKQRKTASLIHHAHENQELGGRKIDPGGYIIESRAERFFFARCAWHDSRLCSGAREFMNSKRRTLRRSRIYFAESRWRPSCSFNFVFALLMGARARALLIYSWNERPLDFGLASAYLYTFLWCRKFNVQIGALYALAYANFNCRAMLDSFSAIDSISAHVRGTIKIFFYFC